MKSVTAHITITCWGSVIADDTVELRDGARYAFRQQGWTGPALPVAYDGHEWTLGGRALNDARAFRVTYQQVTLSVILTPVEVRAPIPRELPHVALTAWVLALSLLSIATNTVQNILIEEPALAAELRAKLIPQVLQWETDTPATQKRYSEPQTREWYPPVRYIEFDSRDGGSE